MKKGCRYLNYSDRQIIEKMIQQGKRVVFIADAIGCHRVTIYRELKRGGIPYQAKTAQMGMKKC